MTYEWSININKLKIHKFACVYDNFRIGSIIHGNINQSEGREVE
jgi:hypothetical protein